MKEIACQLHEVLIPNFKSQMHGMARGSSLGNHQRILKWGETLAQGIELTVKVTTK